MRLQRRRFLFLVAAASVVSSQAMAQNWPTRPVKLVVSAAPGAAPDVIARLVVEKLGPRIGQPIVVENRPSAGQAVALKTVAFVEPDGYTLLMGNSATLAISPALSPELDFSNSKPFVPIGVVATIRNILVASPKLPANTVSEVVAWSKANPGKLNFGASLGSPPQLLGAYFGVKTGANMTYVPYRTNVQAVTDLLAGELQLSAEAPPLLLPHILDGKIKAIVVASAQRLPELPDVPTLSEAGIDGFPLSTWFGINGPAGTPDAIVQKLNAAINDTVNDDAFKSSLAKLGFTAQGGSPRDYAALIAEDARKWANVIKQTGARAE